MMELWDFAGEIRKIGGEQSKRFLQAKLRLLFHTKIIIMMGNEWNKGERKRISYV